MSASGWTQTVFRLRGLPGHISGLEDAANLLGETLGLPSDRIIICSLAKTSNQWGIMSKVATAQFKSVPPTLNLKTTSTEWTFPIPGSDDVLILDTQFEGMTVLNDVEPGKHRADCIAISGLASHPFGSWQPHGPDKSFMWIRDELPRSLPGVRAVLYGYDSRLIGSNSFQSISDIAVSLIWNLKSGGWNLPSSKPIIFLAHSLGGIVLKEAIVQIAECGDKSVAGILDNLLGGIMFGVPNLGMQQSHLMAMVEGQANEMLVQDLSRENGSNYVRQLYTSFNGLSVVHKVKILWAYETEQSPTVIKRSDGSWCREGPWAVLVNIDSATCHYYRDDRSLTIPINKDHSNMVKLSRGDNDLGKVIISLNELLTERLSQPLLVGNDASQDGQTFLGGNMDSQSTSKNILTEDDELLIDLGSFLSSIQEIHDKLYMPELNHRISQIEDAFQNTFKWIFDLDLFTRWLREGSGLFWINGKPGSGKSTLMKYIFQSPLTWDLLYNWRKGSLDIKAGFFFHYRGTAMQKSFEGVLRSLIIQILEPHRTAFQRQYQETWQRYQDLDQQRAIFYYQKEAIIERRRQINAKRDLEEHLQRAMNNNSGDHTVEDIEKQLMMLRKQMEEASKRNPDLGESESELQRELSMLEADIAAVSQPIGLLAKEARPFRTQPEMRFLRNVVAEFRNDFNPHIVRLERILSLLLDQDVKQIDLVLFFDALDEFDGHLDKLSGFLKSLVERSATSATRVKVCFSSRPWKSLNGHFASYPGFRLQDYTKADIEQYATGSLARLGIINLSEVVKLIPSIIARANGVFLWVKLAMDQLFDTVTNSSKAELSERLERKLQELPTDLLEFYKHIIERISETSRRYTFALLQLLARHAGPPAMATDIWGAVLTSGCTTFQESRNVLQSQSVLATDKKKKKMVNDISAWGGGLVEIQERGYIQLMHQTVLEFTMSLLFKRIVMGDAAAILNENGHSFYFKYWLATAGLGRLKAMNDAEMRIAMKRINEPHFVSEDENDRKLAAYHAEESESTTGISQLDYINSVPIPDLRPLLHICPPECDDNTVFLAFASSFGLKLCISDWNDRNPGELQRISLQCEQLPLLIPLAFEPVSGDLDERHRTVASLLFLQKHGYSIAQDTQLFFRLLEKFWRTGIHLDVQGRFKTNINIQAALMLILEELATLLLDHGQDPNIFITLENKTKCTPLHVAPPSLAAELIRYGADVNIPDSDKRTPLDWVLKPPSGFPRRSSAQQYKMCCLLVNAGGLMSESTPAHAWSGTLAEFDSEGYDTLVLRSRDPRRSAAAAPLGGDSNIQDGKQRRRGLFSFVRDLKRKK
ncbi:hypothetical protein ACQKWADRAFT_298002 [Trichoderma austrokoningii]